MEKYSYPDDIGKTNKFVIFSKNIKNTKFCYWNNKPLNEDGNYSTNYLKSKK